MEAVAYLRRVRIAPRKVQIVLDLIRGKRCDLALAILQNTPKAASEPVSKLLKSAMANAENNHDMDVNHLVVSECFVTPGTSMKRIIPAARGRAARIVKRSSHITIKVAEKG